jgi:dipeptidyl aminopeptidase/acylaminoacyl peptidase
MAASTRTITADDLYAMEQLAGLSLSPDGEHVIYGVQRVDRKTEEKYVNFWLVHTRKGAAHQFTYGDHVDSMPRWSPDGTEIAFVSTRGHSSQIYIIPFNGGEARPVSDLNGAIGALTWSPDGKTLAIAHRKKDADAVEREENEQKKKLGVVSRHIKSAFYKLDGAGFLPEEKWHLWTVNAKTGKARQITHGDCHEQSPCWTPDGKSLIFTSNRAENPDINYDNIDLYKVSVSSGRMTKIPTPKGAVMLPNVSPDGKWIAYAASRNNTEWFRNTELWIVPANGKGRAKSLTRDEDFAVFGWTIGDTMDAELMPPTWVGSTIYFQVARHGSTELNRIDTASRKKAVEPVLAESGVIGAYGIAGDTLACAWHEMMEPGQIRVIDLASGKSAIRTKLNRKLLNRIDLGTMEEVWFKGASGNNLQGWILKPPGFRKGKKYPSILEIHGGPLTQYGNIFMHEFYYLAAQGYVVYFSNPRGGIGYGEKHAGAIWNGWGTHDYRDLMKWADYMQKQPYIDRKRMGVTGGSYGGYMTNWIIGHTNRFKAAVTQRCVSNLISMWGSSDFNWHFQRIFGDTPPWENLNNYWKQSPMKYMGNVKTPTLVIHSEKDQRCEIEQGEQVFVALRTQGIDTEFVRYPDEPHGLSRGGRTDRRIDRLHHILRWFDKYL